MSPRAAVGLILALGSAAFVLPYVLLAAPAGYLADRYSKRTVIVACKVAEIGIMLLAVTSILLGSVTMMLVVVALMGGQSALFGPSKLGSIPEMVHPSKISSANGVMELITVVAATLGTVVGNWLATATGEKGQERWWLSAVVLIGVSMAGIVSSVFVRRLKAADPSRRFPWDMASQTLRDVRTLASDTAMLRVTLGIVFFWSLALLAQLNIDQFAFQGGATEQVQVAPLLVALVVGLGTGSVVAGLWSSGRVELGILPLGAGGLALSAMMLFTVEGQLFGTANQWAFSNLLGTSSNALAMVLLVALGFFSGLFNVPLLAYMQRYSSTQHRGAILAACNFLVFGGMLVSLGLFHIITSPPFSCSARQVFLICGVLTVPVLVYIVLLIPQASLRFLAWLLTHTAYKVRVFHRERLPEEGPALLAPNHVSWIDGLFLVAISPRPVRIVLSADLVQSWWSRGLARIMQAIPVPRSPKGARAAIETAREALRSGDLVCIFPEGGRTQTGQLQAFRPRIFGDPAGHRGALGTGLPR